MVKQSKQRRVAANVVFESRSQMKQAFARAKKRHGNYGFSLYVRDLITADLSRK